MRAPSPTLDTGAEYDVRLDHDIAAEPGIGAQEHRLRGHQARPCRHCWTAQPALHQRFGRGEVGAIVDAGQLLLWQFDRAAVELCDGARCRRCGQMNSLFALFRSSPAIRSAGWRAAIAMIPPLTSPIARSSRVASAASTIRSSAPSGPERAGRRRRGLAGRMPRRRSPRCCAAAFAREQDRRRWSDSGVSPNSTSTHRLLPAAPTAGKRAQAGADSIAGAERWILTTLTAAVRRAARRLPSADRSPTTVAAGISGSSAASRCAIIGRPATGCMTLGIADFIRVPPAGSQDDGGETGRLIGGLE